MLDRVYDPRRLRAAWRQVKQNVGTAGIDQMTVEAFERRKDELLAVIHEKLKAGIYRILKLIRRKIVDERLVTLIARALKAGTMVDGRLEKTTKGCPQGSPLSPMLSNIVLNELDQELEKRGHRYCRWADDFVILLKSERAAMRVMEGITGHLENNLDLPINKEKSQVALVKNVTFLGLQILREKIRVSNIARLKFKAKVRELPTETILYPCTRPLKS